MRCTVDILFRSDAASTERLASGCLLEGSSARFIFSIKLNELLGLFGLNGLNPLTLT